MNEKYRVLIPKRFKFSWRFFGKHFFTEKQVSSFPHHFVSDAKIESNTFFSNTGNFTVIFRFKDRKLR